MITHKIFKTEEEMNTFVDKRRLETIKIISIEMTKVYEYDELGTCGAIPRVYDAIKMWYNIIYIK